MLELIMIRHGETDSNKRGSYLGWTDIEINDKGIKQANDAKEKLKAMKVDAIYSSPLLRTAKTAEIINQEFNLNILYSEGLKERNFGIWDDLTYDEIAKNHMEACQLWAKDWIHYCIQDGESAFQTYQRNREFVDGLVKHSNAGTYIIVTHLGCIRNMVSYLLGMGIEGMWKFYADNGSITRITIEDQFAVLRLLNG